MKKFILLCLSLFLVLATAASATLTASVSTLSLGTAAVDASTSATVVKTNAFTLANSVASAVPVTYSLQAASTGTPFPSGVTLASGTTPTSVPASATAEQVSFTLNVAAGTAAGTYTKDLVVDDNDATTTNPRVTLTLVVSTTHNVEVDGGQVLIPITYKNLQDPTNEINVTKEFTVKNTGAFTETVSLSLTSLATGVTNANLTETTGAALASSFTLAAGASKTVKLAATLPIAFDSGISEFGKVLVTFNSGASTSTGSLKVDVESMLKITDLDVEVDDKEDRGVNPGDTIDEDAAPDDSVKMKFKVENMFDNDFGDGDISDAQITVTIDDSDFGDDIDEDSKEFSVDADNTKKDIIVAFTVPEDADEGTYDVNITLEGKDDTNSKNKHTFSMKVKLEVNLESDDVRITSVDLTPATVQCARDATMSIRVRNHGSDDQDEARLQVDNQQLGIDQDFELVLDQSGDSDDEARRSFTFTVPKNLAAGLYPIDSRVFINGDELQDEEHTNLRVEDCQTAGTTTSNAAEEEPTTVVVQAPPTTPPSTTGTDQNAGGVTGGAVFETVEVPLTQSPLFLVVLALGNVVVLGVIVFLAVKFAR